MSDQMSSSVSAAEYGISPQLVMIPIPPGTHQSSAAFRDDLVAITDDFKYFVTLPTHVDNLKAQMSSISTSASTSFRSSPISDPLPFFWVSEVEAWVVESEMTGNFFARRFRSSKSNRMPELVEIGNFVGSDLRCAVLHGEGTRLKSGNLFRGVFERGNFSGAISDQPRARPAILFPDPRINIRSEEISVSQDPFARGAYGRVFKGQFKKFPITPTSSGSTAPGNSSGKFLAVKKFEAPEEFGKEISVLQFLRNTPNVVKLQGVVFEPGNFWLMTSLVSKCLCSEIYSGNLSSLNALEILRDVANALMHMHACNLAHLDLKSPNVLLEISSSTGRAKAVLCDFGHCALLGISDKNPRVGSFGWAAPEALRYDESRISLAADIWSFGCLLWEISVHQQPWRGVQSALVIAAVGYGGCRPENFQGISIDQNSDLKLIADACFEFNPSKRPSIEWLHSELTRLIVQSTKGVDTEISCFLCGG